MLKSKTRTIVLKKKFKNKTLGDSKFYLQITNLPMKQRFFKVVERKQLSQVIYIAYC